MPSFQKKQEVCLPLNPLLTSQSMTISKEWQTWELGTVVESWTCGYKIKVHFSENWHELHTMCPSS